MGTIAEKLTYLSDTKDKLKESINNLGGSITNETTFRAYAEELDNIYSNIPKTTGEGSNLSLTTIKGRINVDDILGDTEQIPTNIFDGEFRQGNQNSTSVSARIFSNQEMKIASGETLTFETDLDTSTFSYAFYIMKNPFLTSGNTQLWYSNYQTTKTFSFTSNYSGYVGFTIRYTDESAITPSVVANNSFSIKFASPNPDYPQDIEVVTGQQDVVVQTANYFKPQLQVNGTDITQVRCSVTLQDDEFTFVASGNDMYLGNVGTSGTSYGNNRGTLIKLPTNASKVYVTTTNTDFNANYICWYDENKTTLGFTLSHSVGDNIPSGAKYINVRIGKADSVSGTTYKTKVMVRIDDNTTSYVEHQEQTKTLHLGDIELAKIGTYQDRIYKNSDKWYIEKKNKQITLGNVPEIQTGDIFGVTCKYAVYRGISDMRRTTTQSYDFYCNRVSKSNGVATKYSGYTVAQNIVVIVDDNDTLESASEKLNGSIFYYPLATPTYTEITNTTLLNELNELEKMMSYNGKTNINISGNLPMILNVSALKGE